jgi:hypothetical protein
VHQHFLRYSGELVAGALNDLVHAGLLSRSGWGEKAVYRHRAADGAAESRRREPVRPILVAGQSR